MSGKQVYEVQGLRAHGTVYSGEVLEVESVDDARALAQQFADRWQAAVKLYRVPFVHTGSDPWTKGQMHPICRVEPKR